MAVLKPLKLVIENYPDGMVEELEAENNPENPEMGTRKLLFSNVIYIEQDDFMENPPKKFFRLTPGQEVRLKHAYIIKCEQVIKDEAGEVIELRCTYDPATKSGESGSARKVKGVLHWVSAAQAIPAEVRLYDYLLMDDQANEGEYNMNPNSLISLSGSLVEPSLAQAKPGEKFQFLRQGYFCMDRDSIPGKPVFNRIVGLRDTWAKLQK
jgi:glutaminyl-tRNA synthetase